MGIVKGLLSFCGFMGVLLGAFGAHYLKNRLSPNDLSIWTTATYYLLIHATIGLFSSQVSSIRRAPLSFLLGCLLFSGSLFLIIFTKWTPLGILTPLGGLCFLLGWWQLVMCYFKNQISSEPIPMQMKSEKTTPPARLQEEST